MNEEYKDKHISWILSGGGSRGAFQAGALQPLIRAGLEPDSVLGTSVGALNGALVAARKPNLATQIWWSIEEEDVYGPGSLVDLFSKIIMWKIGFGAPPLGFRSTRPLRRLLNKHLGPIEPKVPFFPVSVWLESGEVVYKHNEQDFIDKVLASASIPGYSEPVRLGEEYTLVDGGVTDISPLGLAIKHFNPDIVVIVNCQNPWNIPRRSGMDDIIAIGERSLELLTAEVFRRDLDQFLEINRIVRIAQKQGVDIPHKTKDRNLKAFDTVLVQPADDKRLYSGTTFETKLLRGAWKHGYNQATKAVNTGFYE